MKKVCIISTVHHAFDTRIFFRQAQSLLRLGLEVVFIVQHPYESDLVNGIKIIGLPIVEKRSQRISRVWLAFRLALAENADIYHIHDPELMPFGILLKWIKGKPVICDVHEHYPDAILEKNWIPGYLRRILSLVFDITERFLASQFSALIVADDAIRQRFFRNQARIETIYNFPKKDSFSNEKEVIPIPRSHQYQLVYVGAITAQRGLWLMVEIMEILINQYKMDFGLWLVGNIGSDRDKKKFEKVMQESSELQSRITAVGKVPFNQVPVYLRNADIGLVPLQPIPKYLKNIPTKQFEYMAAGLPIVGSNLPPIRDFLEPNQAGLLADPLDASSFVAQILTIAHNPDRAARMGLNGIKAFLEKYNWDNEQMKLFSLYKRLLEINGTEIAK